MFFFFSFLLGIMNVWLDTSRHTTCTHNTDNFSFGFCCFCWHPHPFTSTFSFLLKFANEPHATFSPITSCRWRMSKQMGVHGWNYCTTCWSYLNLQLSLSESDNKKKAINKYQSLISRKMILFANSSYRSGGRIYRLICQSINSIHAPSFICKLKSSVRMCYAVIQRIKPKALLFTTFVAFIQLNNTYFNVYHYLYIFSRYMREIITKIA